MANWSELPKDLVFEVAQHFESPKDTISFCATCRDWGREDISSVLKAKWSGKMPWIMLPESGEDFTAINRCVAYYDDPCTDPVSYHMHRQGENLECMRNLFDPLASKVYPMKFPELCGRTCFGSPYGWLLTVGGGRDLDVNLFNPITRCKISLPSLWTLRPDQLQCYASSTACHLRTNFVVKGIVLRLPAASEEDSSFMVFLLYDSTSGLAFARPGDSTWSLVEIEGAQDVVFWKDKFLIAVDLGDLSYFDYDESILFPAEGATTTHHVVVPKVYIHGGGGLAGMMENQSLWFRVYLLEVDDEIYMIARDKILFDYKEDEEGDCTKNYKTIKLQIFKLDMISKMWKEIEDLGGLVLYVGNNSVMHTCGVVSSESSSISGAGTCPPPNSICFMDDDKILWTSLPCKAGGHDAGIYSLGTKKISSSLYPHNDIYSAFCGPFFLRPSLT